MGLLSRQRESQWCTRHHVTVSSVNILAPKHRRAYFDHLPVVGRARGGEFSDIVAFSPTLSGEAAEHEERVHKRYKQFPEYWRRQRWPNCIWSGSDASTAGDGASLAGSAASSAVSTRPNTAETDATAVGAGQRYGIASSRPHSGASSPSRPRSSLGASRGGGGGGGNGRGSRPDSALLAESGQDPRSTETPSPSSCSGSPSRAVKRPCFDQLLAAAQLLPSSPRRKQSQAARSGEGGAGTGAAGSVRRGASPTAAKGEPNDAADDATLEKRSSVSRGRAVLRAAVTVSTLLTSGGDEEKPFEEDKDLAFFLSWVKAKQGHLVALWHKLDNDRSMLLHKGEFTQGLKRLGYKGNIERLWRKLDRDTTGNVSFLEFAPEAALEIARFKMWSEAKYGNTKALFAALDDDRSGSISYGEFRAAIIKHGLPEELKDTLKPLFMLLDYDESDGRGTISEEEMRFLDIWKLPAYLWETPDVVAVTAFKEALLARHNQNALRVWRRALDKDSSMRVSFEEFTIQCKALAKRGYPEAAPKGGVTGMYVAIDDDRSGYFTLREWDAPSFVTLSTFVRFCRSQYGTLNKFLRAAEVMQSDDGEEKADRNGGIPLGKFRRALRPSGLTAMQTVSLFEALEAPMKSRHIGRTGLLFPADISFLAHWDPDSELNEERAWSALASSKMGSSRGGGLRRLNSMGVKRASEHLRLSLSAAKDDEEEDQGDWPGHAEEEEEEEADESMEPAVAGFLPGEAAIWEEDEEEGEEDSEFAQELQAKHLTAAAAESAIASSLGYS